MARRGADFLLQVRCAVYNGIGATMDRNSSPRTIHLLRWRIAA